MPVLRVDDLELHYVESGPLDGPAVLLLHGWPTSSLLWRNVMPRIAGSGQRVIALDLPGFGASSKPADASYSFRFFDRALDGFVDGLGLDRLGLAVHDLGGPVGLHWALARPDRIRALALLNTLVYPELSWAAVAFVAACRTPGLRSLLTRRWGLEQAMRIGVYDRSRLSDEVLAGVVAPFGDRAARRALARAGCGLHPGGLATLAATMPQYAGPVRVIYGEEDRILPDVARTMARVKADLPQAEVTPLAGCGHFLQEDQPEAVGALLGAFFGAVP